MSRSAPTKHPVHDLIRDRYSPRTFADREVPPEVLRSMMEAARWAASCFNDQPWSFLVGTRSEPDAYARILACLGQWNQSWAASAPVLMISVAKRTFDHNGTPNRHALHDVGAATAQMTLEALSHGVYLHPMGGFDMDKARETLAIPETHEPVAAIAVGYLGDLASLPEDLREREVGSRERKPASSFVFGAGWGSRPVWLDES